VGFVEGETGSCSETCVTCDGDGTEEVSIEVEDTVDIKEEVRIKEEGSIDIKDEIPEAITFPKIKTEPEVRLWGVCELVAAHDFRPFMAPERKLKLQKLLHAWCHVLCHIRFEIWTSVLKRRDFWKL
jgi:hypothetical protein